MNITRLAIEKNRVTIAFLVVVVLMGLQAYVGMPQSEDPGFTIRTAMVITYFPGASPGRVEQLVTDKLEKAIQEIPQVDVINRQIFPLMERMIDGLEQSIALDVPFLMGERSDRVEKLEETMARSDVSVAEKFRKVMEAYQIENDYGSTIETYKESLTLEDGTTRDYNMLRIGRVGLYFQSEDTNITGRWDNQQRKFVRDDGARNEVRKGLRIANQLIAPELILVPVDAAAEAG